MRNAIARIVRLSMRAVAIYSFVLAGACMWVAGRSAVRLFIFNRAPNDSASGLDPIGVALGLTGALFFAIAGRWVWRTARTFGRAGPVATMRDDPRPSTSAADNHQDRLP